jgi:hypothetical protein
MFWGHDNNLDKGRKKMHNLNNRPLQLRTMQAIAILGATISAAACEDAVGFNPTSSQAEQGTADPDSTSSDTSSLTIATYDLDGHLSVRQQPLTNQQREEMIRQRTTQTTVAESSMGASGIEETSEALTVEPTCPSSSMWIFSGTSLTGNFLCLSKAPGSTFEWATLTSFSYPGFFQTWSGRVASFWAGSDPGYFGIVNSNYHNGFRFGPYQRADSFPNSQYATTIQLDNKPKTWLNFYLYSLCGVSQSLAINPSNANLDTGRAFIDLRGCTVYNSEPTLFGMTYNVSYSVSFENPLHTSCDVFTDMWGTYINNTRACGNGGTIAIDRGGCGC